jgi:hypothetical protein
VGERPFNERSHLVGLRHVRRDRRRLTGLRDPRRGLFRSSLVDIAHNDVRALFAQSQAQRATDPGATSRDQRDLSGKLSRHATIPFVVRLTRRNMLKTRSF